MLPKGGITMSLRKSSKPKCVYCGGMHHSNECPMYMMPPAMPMPSYPMGGCMGGMMPDMGMGGMMGDMGMGGMMPGMDMQQMMQMMHEHSRLLHEIHQGVSELLMICQAMQTGNAKG